MKYCINSRNKKLLPEASEIMVIWNNRVDVLDLCHDYSVPVILDVPYSDKVDLESEIDKLKIQGNGKLVLRLNSLADAGIALKHGVDFYFGNNLKNFTDLNGAISLGAKYVMLSPYLFHNIEEVRKRNATIRLNPTTAKTDIFDFTDGSCGCFVRPEDIGLYEDCIIEFGDVDTNKEITLHKIYESRSWPGRLDLVVDGLDIQAVNRLVVPEFSERRANCGMTCVVNNGCHLCHTVLNLATKKKEIKKALEE